MIWNVLMKQDEKIVYIIICVLWNKKTGKLELDSIEVIETTLKPYCARCFTDVTELVDAIREEQGGLASPARKT